MIVEPLFVHLVIYRFTFLSSLTMVNLLLLLLLPRTPNWTATLLRMTDKDNTTRLLHLLLMRLLLLLCLSTPLSLL